MSIWKKSLAVTSAIACALTVVNANNNDDSEIIDLDAYTVAASKVALPVGTVGSSLTILTEQDTARFATEMMTESLRHVPGLYIRNSGNIGSTAGITMRGLPIAPVVLIDGVEVNNPGNGNVFNFGNLPTAIVESVEVLRGAQSALYGANALTGVISINTKKGVTVDPSAVLGVSYGSHETFDAYATVSQAGDKFNYFVSASYHETGGYSVQDPTWGPEWADDDYMNNLNVIGKMEYALFEILDFSLVASHTESDSEFDPGTPSPWSVPVADNYLEHEQDLLKALLELDASDNIDLSASVTYNNSQNYAVDGFGVRDSEAEVLKGEILGHIQANDVYQVVAGFDYESASDKIGDYEMDTVSVFVENLLEVAENVNATFAVRYDDNDTFGEETSYRGSLSWLIEDLGLQFKGSYGTSYDAPEISQLFGTWGNPDLVAEDGVSFDVGFEQELMEGNLVWGVNYFNVEMEDHIEFLRSTFSFVNVDWESNGFETFVRYSMSDDFNVQLSHSFANAERKGVDDDLLFHSPEHQISLLLDKAFLDNKLNTSVTVLHVGDRETWDGETDAYVTVDIAARYKLNENTQVWARVDNLFDEEYQEVRGYMSPGLGFFAGVKYEF